MRINDNQLDPNSPYNTGSTATLTIIDALNSIESDADLLAWLDANELCTSGWMSTKIPHEIGRTCKTIDTHTRMVTQTYMITGTNYIIKIVMDLLNPQSINNTIRVIPLTFKSLSL